MFIHSVTTPRKIKVNFNPGKSTQGNEISILTGPNGSGKTEVLATIADVFHGAIQHEAGAQIEWSRGGSHRTTNTTRQGDEPYRGRVRLIAQTFSPFSRFPGIEYRRSSHLSPIYARGHSSEEEYVCIGFNQHRQVNLQHLSRSIFENGIHHLSEQPEVARVAFEVLEELGFKNGINLGYRGQGWMAALFRAVNDKLGMEKIIQEIGMPYSPKFLTRGNPPAGLVMELRKENASEIAEYIRSAIHLVSEYIVNFESRTGKEIIRFNFNAFRGREAMSSDFAILQSFSLLRRLDLLEIDCCMLTPYQGRTVDLTQTSSGQQQMLCSIFGLAAALENDAIILIDEPELSLHPRWQMNFLKHIKTALKAVHNCHVIIATHSPLITQAGVAHGAEVIQMGGAVNGQAISSKSERDNVSIEGLLVDSFSTPIPNSLHISNEIFQLVTKAESGTHKDMSEALEKLNEYLRLYQRDGEGASKMTALLNKAIHLLSATSRTLDR